LYKQAVSSGYSFPTQEPTSQRSFTFTTKTNYLDDDLPDNVISASACSSSDSNRISRRIPSRMPFSLNQENSTSKDDVLPTSTDTNNNMIASSIPKELLAVSPKPEDKLTAFKKHLFEESKYREYFKTNLTETMEKVSDINDLVPYVGGQVVTLYIQCMTFFVYQVEAAIEMTRIFIRHGFDFNKKTNGQDSEKSSLHSIFSLFVLREWHESHSRSFIEMIQLILDEGNADPHVKDDRDNDALKTALFFKVPHELIKIVCMKAMTSDPGDLFTSKNKYGNTVSDFIHDLDLPEETKQFLLEMQVKPKESKRESEDTNNNNDSTANLFKDFANKYPKEFEQIEASLASSVHVNDKIETTPIYSFCLEALMSFSGCQLESTIALTNRFIELGVDFNLKDSFDKTCLCLSICLKNRFTSTKQRKTINSIVRLILSHGSDVTLRDNERNDVLKHAVMNDYPTCILQEILKSAGERELQVLTSVNLTGEDVVQIASLSCSKEISSFLTNRIKTLSKKKNQAHQEQDNLPKTKEMISKETCKSFASEFPNEYSLIKDLVQNHAVDEKVNGIPLYCVCIEKLMEKSASKKSMFYLTRTFINLGVDFNLRDQETGHTCLTRAITTWLDHEYNGIVIVMMQLMLENGASVWLKDKKGNDSLKLAVRHWDHFKVYEQIFSASDGKGYEMLVSKNKSGLNAIQIARLYNPSVCDFLVGLFRACHDRFDFMEMFGA